jgi:dienelactone hydrolase
MRDGGIDNRYVEIRAGGITLPGRLTLPVGAQGLILFVHGSGSSRLSPRNQQVAESLQAAGFGTLLFDLLTMTEERVDEETSALRFNIDLLSGRVTDVIDWLLLQEYRKDLKYGLFGASTGAAAALVTAADRPQAVQAVVSRGGRPDLAGEHLSQVRAPSLFIVGSLDNEVLGLNQSAMEKFPDGVEKHLEVVQGASHLFEEPGKLDAVAHLAQDWFLQYIGPAQRSTPDHTQ